MLRVASVFLALQAALVLSASPDDVELPAAQHDDECLASEPGSCALSALQRRGAKVAAAAAERVEDVPATLEELELLEADEVVEESSFRRDAASTDPDITVHAEVHESRELKHRAGSIAKVSKLLTKVEGSVNETYSLVMKELAPDKDAQPPPMPKLRAKSSRRRRHAAAVHLPPREKKVAKMVGKCEGAMKGVWARIKRCSNMMVFTEKRITGGEIELFAGLQAFDDESLEAEPTDEDEETFDDEILEAEPADEDEEDDEPLEQGDDTVSVESAKGDLQIRIKQLSKENKDALRDVKGMGKRAIRLRKLFNETYRMS